MLVSLWSCSPSSSGSFACDAGLVACGNLIPSVRSIYRWQGKVEDASEVLCVLKTRADRVEELIAELARIHPYDVPEILVLPVVAGAHAYLDWVRGECEPPPAGG